MNGAAADLCWSLVDWEASTDECKLAWDNVEKWSQVPLLNFVPNHKLHDQQLVRFRGMIQHMSNPEFYLGQYEVLHKENKEVVMRSGRYRDVLNCMAEESILESSRNVIEERQILYCVTIPAMNDWVVQESVKEDSGSKISAPSLLMKTTQGKTRKHSTQDDFEMDTDACTRPGSSSGTLQSSPDRSHQETKRIATEAANSISRSDAQLPFCNLNFPIDGSSGMACIVKVYEPNFSLKLNDTVDVLGFLSLDPSLASIKSDLALDAENRALNPPPSMVPRLHAISIRKILHCNSMPTNLGDVFKSARNIHKELHLLLSQVLLGDTLAAEYLICHLISMVYMRKDNMALGRFSINLSNIPNCQDYTRLLYSILMRILPKSHYLAMTLDNMNKVSFIPKMDYEENRLSAGLLQLSNNTHLVVDETRLETGTLDSTGVNNVQALKALISQQTVDYDFQYYSKAYDADVPVLVFSEGKSLLPNDVLVPLLVDSSCLNTIPEIFQAANYFLREPLLSAVRVYLAAMRHSSYEFPDDVQKKAQDDFVAMRQLGGQTVSGDDLHLLLVLARLISLSDGESTVSVQSWEKAKRMEEERKSRIGLHTAHCVNPSTQP